LVIDEFRKLIFLFNISAPTGTTQSILILSPCLTILYTGRSKVRLIVATDCTVLRATELHSSAAQKFLSEVTVLSARNVDRGACVTKLHAFDRCKPP